MPSFHDQDLSRSLGLHRVLEPHGVLPQPAWKLDNTPIVYATETLVDVDMLHLDNEFYAGGSGR
jgi:L-erythro-3,5-diaminohexanoate dehydrogenase